MNKQSILKTFWLIALMITINFISQNIYAQEAKINYIGGNDPFIYENNQQEDPTDLFYNLKDLMPGDHIQTNISIHNNCQNQYPIDVFLQCLKIINDSQLTDYSKNNQKDLQDINDFLSKLDMKVWQNIKNEDQSEHKTLIYHASPDQPAQLSNPILLGNIKYNQKIELTVDLNVPLSLDNNYIARIGEVHWSFIVEEKPTPTAEQSAHTSNKSGNISDNIKNSADKKGLLARTGENYLTYTASYVCILFILLILGIKFYSYMLKRKNDF